MPISLKNFNLPSVTPLAMFLEVIYVSMLILFQVSAFIIVKSQNSSYTATYHPSRKLSKLDEPDMQDTAGEAGMRS